MSSVTLFDHYSPQTHESVEVFLSNWGERPWNDMNIPVGVQLYKDDDNQHFAEVVVFLPRKQHAKVITIGIKSDEELERLRATFLGIAETLYGAAASKLEHFARGAMSDHEPGEWGGLILYYWDSEEEK